MRREGDIACLNEFDDLIFLSLITQLDILGIEVESGIGVVVEVHIQLIAYLSRHIEIYLLVKVNGFCSTIAYWQRRIVDILDIATQFQFCRSHHLDAHTTGTKYLVGRTEIKMHVGKIKLVLPFGCHIFGILLAKEGAHPSFERPLVILIRGHQQGSSQIASSHLLAYNISVGGVVIVHLERNIARHAKVKGDGVEVGNRPGGGALRSPSGLYHTIDHAVGHNGQRHRRYFQRCLLVLLSHGKSTNAQHHHGDMTYTERQSLPVLFI